MTPITKIVVAIHGIGSQSRSETIRSVATRFGARGKVPLMPLGFFHVEGSAKVTVSRLEVPATHELAQIGFAEVFWADIPRAVVEKKDTLEETKAWGATVVSRAHAAYENKVKAGGNAELDATDFQLVAGAVDEVLETIDVLENITLIAAKAGLFKFDLGPLLRDYLGDVQVVAEFNFYRQQIVRRFDELMNAVLEYCDKRFGCKPEEIHIVAHSEGTVVSFLALLQAMSGAVQDPAEQRLDDVAAAKSPPWIRLVRGYMTIGSPIDKHLVLWPDMWKDVRSGGVPRAIDMTSSRDAEAVVFRDPRGGERLRLPHPIRWRNYYDYGDPIGFRLDTAESWLQKRGCAAFEFDTKKHDFGFSRYWLPGKAHNDYWTDDEVFGHFIADVVLPGGGGKPQQPVAAPKGKPVVAVVSTSLPYGLSLLCHFAAIFWLFKAVTTITDTKIPNVEAGLELAGLTLLLVGITVAARLPRLLKPRWPAKLGALSAIVSGIGLYLWLTPEAAQERLSTGFAAFQFSVCGRDLFVEAAVLAVIPVVLSWLWPRKPRRGRRILMLSGAAGVTVLVAARVWGETAADAAVWPLVLAGAGFLYLWWLGVLVFDLAFMWHRYIRRSAAIDNLWFWEHRQDTPHSGKARAAAKNAASPEAAAAVATR